MGQRFHTNRLVAKISLDFFLFLLDREFSLLAREDIHTSQFTLQLQLPEIRGDPALYGFQQTLFFVIFMNFLRTHSTGTLKIQFVLHNYGANPYLGRPFLCSRSAYNNLVQIEIQIYAQYFLQFCHLYSPAVFPLILNYNLQKTVPGVPFSVYFLILKVFPVNLNTQILFLY